MEQFRRDFLKLAGASLGAGAIATVGASEANAQPKKAMPHSGNNNIGYFNIRTYGATGDGKTIDTAAINKAIEAANANGGGTVYFPAGTYASYSIHMKSNVVLYLEQGCVLLAAETPEGGTHQGAYDPAEPNDPWEKYQEYGHNHYHNSLIWGENIDNFGIMGPGLIWGKGLSNGRKDLPLAETPGVGNKSIAFRNCHNVILRDFSILKGGHFGVLVTGVDNLTIDNLKIDTDRDGIDIICCRNVRVSNCSVNSPWDDAICPKSQYILGYLRATENLTITNCYVTGNYELGSMLDGTWKKLPPDTKLPRTGRIKCGTESNAGFKNITISNCVFDGSGGFALETVDGAHIEDITFTGITMRDCTNTPLFLRLGARMRAPADLAIGTFKRVIISNVVSYNSLSPFGGAGLISGIPGHCIEDVKINEVYMEHVGGGTPDMASIMPPEEIKHYPEPTMFGKLPGSSFFVRHAKNLEFTNVELAWSQPDARPAFWMQDVDGVDIFRLKLPKTNASPVFHLDDVRDFHVSGSRSVKETHLDKVDQKSI
jgi:polygalacturonase